MGWHPLTPSCFPSLSNMDCHKNPQLYSLPPWLVACPVAAGENHDGHMVLPCLPGLLESINLLSWLGSGETWGAFQNGVGPRVNPGSRFTEGPSWQVVVGTQKDVMKWRRAEWNFRCLWPFSAQSFPQSRFSLFSLLWETPQNQMKNLGRECGFVVQSPVTKSVNKVRTRHYGCEEFCFFLFPFQTHYCCVGQEI